MIEDLKKGNGPLAKKGQLVMTNTQNYHSSEQQESYLICSEKQLETKIENASSD